MLGGISLSSFVLNINMLDQLLLLLLLPLCTTSTVYVHPRVVHVAMSSSSSSSSSSSLAPPTLPDSFRSFGAFSFIETIEDPTTLQEAAVKQIKSSTKPIPKKLKCACEFQKVEAETNAVAASFLEKVVVSTKSPMLRK